MHMFCAGSIDIVLSRQEMHLSHEEMLAARAQDRLLLKDKRIFGSLNLAARKQVLSLVIAPGAVWYLHPFLLHLCIPRALTLTSVPSFFLQALAAEDEDEKFKQARNTQMMLDQRLGELT